MKISHWIRDFTDFVRGMSVVEYLVIFAIIMILAAMILPAIAKAKQREQQASQNAQIEKTQSFQVGETVTVQGLDYKGTINYISDSGFVDVLVKSYNGEPTVLKGINPKLLNK